MVQLILILGGLVDLSPNNLEVLILVLSIFTVVSIQIIPVKLPDGFVLLALFAKITITPIKIFWELYRHNSKGSALLFNIFND